jgi:hypothetical protein
MVQRTGANLTDISIASYIHAENAPSRSMRYYRYSRPRLLLPVRLRTFQVFNGGRMPHDDHL